MTKSKLGKKGFVLAYSPRRNTVPHGKHSGMATGGKHDRGRELAYQIYSHTGSRSRERERIGNESRL